MDQEIIQCGGSFLCPRFQPSQDDALEHRYNKDTQKEKPSGNEIIQDTVVEKRLLKDILEH